MSLLKKLAGETAIYGLSSILSRVLNYLILTPYLTRWFGETDYGIISILFFYASVLTVFYTFRMETAFFRFGSRDDQLDTAFSTASISILLSTLVLSGSLLLFSGSISQWLQFADHPEYVYWIVGIIAFDALMAIPFARLRLKNKAIQFALAKTLGILINIGFIFFFLKLCPYLIEQGCDWVHKIYQAENQISYVFVSNLIASFAIMLLLSPAYFRIKLQLDRVLLKRMLWYAAPLVAVALAAAINQSIGMKLLEDLLPGTLEDNRGAAGQYSAAAKIAVLMNLFTQAFNYAAEPFFFRHSERSDSKRIYAQTGQAFAIVGSLVFLGIMLFMDVIRLFIGEELRSGLDIVPILLLANLALGLYYNFAIWFKLKDRTEVGAYISISGMLVTLGLNYTLIPNIGYFGPAWAILACYIFMAMASYWTGRRHFPIPYPMLRIFLYILSAIAFYFISLQVRPYLGDSLAVILPINSLILLTYIIFIYVFERKTIHSILNN
ncbi:MAG: oligosaccharide flippase family protein [Bacteroidota bacterium]